MLKNGFGRDIKKRAVRAIRVRYVNLSNGANQKVAKNIQTYF